MRKILLLFIILILNASLCLAASDVCYDGVCFTQIYSYPKLGFYAFISKEDTRYNNNYRSYGRETPVAKLARLYSFDTNQEGKLIVCYTRMPDINAFKNAPKNNLGDLEKAARNLARSYGPATGHLTINSLQSGYIQHTDFIINKESRVLPVRYYKEW